MLDSLENVLNQFFDFRMSSIWTGMPCICVNDLVQDEMRIDVQPLINLLYKDGRSLQQAVILNVPVQMPSTANSLLYLPLSKGDIVWCEFAQRSLDAFLAGDGTLSDPADFRRFDQRDAVALPGIWPYGKTPTSNKTIPDDPKALSLTNNIGTSLECTIQLNPDGSIKLISPNGLVSVEAQNVNATATNSLIVNVPTTNWTGNATFTGNYNFVGSVIINGIEFSTHVHAATPASSPTDVSGPPEA